MRFDFGIMPRPLLHIITLFLASTAVSASPAGDLQGLSWGSLFGRGECAGTLCGYNSQLCCPVGEACYTDSSNQAQCSSTAVAATTTAYAANGYWTQYTTTYVETDLVTVTSVMSSYIPEQTTALVATTTSASCNYAYGDTPCGNICCASDQYCYTSGYCTANVGGGSSGYYSTIVSTSGYSAPLLPTSSTLVVATATISPTTTIPFVTPLSATYTSGATATGTLVPVSTAHSSSLSGGAIAGIVIGVLLGLALLFLICFYCCLKGLFDGVLALLGLGKRRRTTETEYIEERRHHSSYGGGGGRTWYGSRPSRVERRSEKKSGGSNLLGIGAALAGLWALLGLSRRRDRKRQEKSEYTGSSYGSYYTSESE